MAAADKLSVEAEEAIATSMERTAVLAERHGVSKRRIQQIRAEYRSGRREAAREVVAQHVRVELPADLDDLKALRLHARERALDADNKGAVQWARILLDCLNTDFRLHGLEQDTRRWDGWTPDELERYADTGEVPEGRSLPPGGGALRRA